MLRLKWYSVLAMAVAAIVADVAHAENLAIALALIVTVSLVALVGANRTTDARRAGSALPAVFGDYIDRRDTGDGRAVRAASSERARLLALEREVRKLADDLGPNADLVLGDALDYLEGGAG